MSIIKNLRRARRGLTSSSRERGSLGQSVAEFAMIVPVALLLMGATLDLGRLFEARLAIENAAREGAFQGATNPRCDSSSRTLCDDPDTAQWRVQNEVGSMSGLTMSFTCHQGGSTVAVTACASGDVYEATVTTTFDFVTPLLEPLLGTTMTLEASASTVVLSDAFDPSATPVPGPSLPPMCTVPDMEGMTRNDARSAWTGAGFVQQNFLSPGMNANDIVDDQSLPDNTDDPCATAVVLVSE